MNYTNKSELSFKYYSVDVALELLVNLTCNSLICGTKPEEPEKTHVCTGKASRHPERSPAGRPSCNLLAEGQQLPVDHLTENLIILNMFVTKVENNVF